MLTTRLQENEQQRNYNLILADATLSGSLTGFEDFYPQKYVYVPVKINNILIFVFNLSKNIVILLKSFILTNSVFVRTSASKSFDSFFSFFEIFCMINFLKDFKDT